MLDWDANYEEWEEALQMRDLYAETAWAVTAGEEWAEHPTKANAAKAIMQLERLLASVERTIEMMRGFIEDQQ